MKRVTSWYVRIVLTVLIAVLLFVVIGCSFVAYDDISSPDYIEQIVNPDRSLFYGETITIAAYDTWIILPFINAYMLANPGVNIQVTQHLELDQSFRDTTDWGQVRMEIGTQLMAGSGPTLIYGYLADPLDPRQAVFYYDWYQLMDADPNFKEEDWFMNVFHAFAIGDQLFHFPISVTYSPVVANRSIPGLLEAMTEYADGITLSELMQLNSYFSERHPQHYLEMHFSSAWIMQLMSEQFVDVEAGRVDFGDVFIDLIIYADSITCHNFNSEGWTPGWNGVFSSSTEQMISERYLFHLDTNFWFWYWLDYYEEIQLFAGMTPLTNVSRELLIAPRDNFLLNANATPIEKAIAWDFMMFVMQPENFTTQLSHSWHLQPPNRNLFEYLIRRFLFYSWDHPRFGDRVFPWFPGTHYEAAEVVFARMTPFAEMPMRTTSNRPRIVDEIIEDNLYLFYAGLLSAEQTAQNLQNQITLVLMEMER